jgi:NADPH:quinone reductase
MRAVRVVRLDGPSAVVVEDVPEPVAGPDQVLVDVHAVGVNFPDLLQSKGQYQYKPEVPFTLGSESAGVVRSAPEGSGFSAGDRVVAFAGQGAFAEVVVCNQDRTFPLPDEVSFTAGAGLPMNYLTAHFTLLRRGRLAEGETVLVHGAAGGVGTATVQLAAALGHRVIAVVSTQAKAEVAKKAGATDTVLVEGFKDAVKELTGGRGVDVVVDPVGGDRFTDSLRSLAKDGRLLVVGFTAGDIPQVKVNRLLLNNLDVVGVGWGAYVATQPPGYVREQWDELVPHLRSGALDPPIDGSYTLDDAAAALERLDKREVTGKIVLTV